MGETDKSRPSLASLFMGFVRIGMASFGGGLAAWTRREVVQNQKWMSEREFLSGYALSQLVPGATNVNLAVFIGAQLRGLAGSLACFAGLTFLPIVIILIIGTFYIGGHGGRHLSIALSGMGAIALGMNIGLGTRLALNNLRQIGPVLITAAIAVGIGIFGIPLLEVLAVMMPISLMVAWWSLRQ